MKSVKTMLIAAGFAALALGGAASAQAPAPSIVTASPTATATAPGSGQSPQTVSSPDAPAPAATAGAPLDAARRDRGEGDDPRIQQARGRHRPADRPDRAADAGHRSRPSGGVVSQRHSDAYHRHHLAVRAAAARLGDGALQSARQSGAVAHLAQHDDRDHLDGGARADPARDRGALDQAARRAIFDPQARSDRQGDRPPMVLVVPISRQRRLRGCLEHPHRGSGQGQGRAPPARRRQTAW